MEKNLNIKKQTLNFEQGNVMANQIIIQPPENQKENSYDYVETKGADQNKEDKVLQIRKDEDQSETETLTSEDESSSLISNK